MDIKEISDNKKDFMDILLIGDEDEAMINKYLEQSQLFVLYDNNIPVSICAVIQDNKDTIEIKNLATYPEYQNRGYASKLIEFVCWGLFATLEM